jgi:transcriptional regulator with GAF, ATPase, and Fis domain
MGLKILIVEDEFLEANHLSIILKNAAHEICGTAKSVNQALSSVRSLKPDIVLVDIFLKGERTGIDLGYILDKQKIPFIYLSANTKPSTLEEAVLTNPYGFLTKPYRDREILIALNIAVYRSKKNREMVLHQEEWLESLLTNIKACQISWDQKLSSLIGALTSFLPFDIIVIDTDHNSTKPEVVHAFQRIGFDKYELIDHPVSLLGGENNVADYWATRKRHDVYPEPYFLNGDDFTDDCSRIPIREKLRRQTKVASKLWLPLGNIRSGIMSITFYSNKEQSYTWEHINLLSFIQAQVEQIVRTIASEGINGKNSIEIGVPVPLAPNQSLQPQIEGIIGNSPKLLEALDKITQVAPFDNTALILGETGVGKEGLVRALHALSPRKNKPLIKVNCAAIPIHLVESELFGHERGAFTGAAEKRLGKFELAHGGTLFLDEIGELPLEIQSKLLRAIQEKEIERVGGRTTVKTDVRIVAATNRNLLSEISQGRFRMDLYYRINVFPITLPPLRERKEDISMLADHFLVNLCKLVGRIKITISPAAMKQLTDYSWPGNIRELQNLIERHVLQLKSDTITQFEMPERIPGTGADIQAENEPKSFDDVDREHILAALKKSNGKISGRGGAAELLKLKPTTLNSKMKRLGISRFL